MPTYEISIDGRARRVELTRRGERTFTVVMGDKTLDIELTEGRPDLNRFTISIDGRPYEIELPGIDRDGPFPVKVDGATFEAEVRAAPWRPAAALETPRPRKAVRAATPKPAAEGAVTAPMTGVVVSVMVERGEAVEAGQVLCVLEAMKMENEIKAPRGGTVQEVLVSEGSAVNEGEALLVIV